MFSFKSKIWSLLLIGNGRISFTSDIVAVGDNASFGNMNSRMFNSLICACPRRPGIGVLHLEFDRTEEG